MRTPSYEPCLSIKEALKDLTTKFGGRPDFIPPPIKEILPSHPHHSSLSTKEDEDLENKENNDKDDPHHQNQQHHHIPTTWPQLNGRYLNCGPKDTR